ncbi:MAG: hypothetical protein ACFB2W_12925, partial [Leptolyngbyaceae cyanobacterium]
QAVFSHDGSYLVLCDIDHMLTVWHHNQLVSKRSTQLSELPYALNICNSGSILLRQDNRGLGFWNLMQQQCVQRWDAVGDPDQYQGCKFYEGQGLSSSKLLITQSLGAIVLHSST